MSRILQPHRLRTMLWLLAIFTSQISSLILRTPTNSTESTAETNMAFWDLVQGGIGHTATKFPDAKLCGVNATPVNGIPSVKPEDFTKLQLWLDDFAGTTITTLIVRPPPTPLWSDPRRDRHRSSPCQDIFNWMDMKYDLRRAISIIRDAGHYGPWKSLSVFKPFFDWRYEPGQPYYKLCTSPSECVELGLEDGKVYTKKAETSESDSMFVTANTSLPATS